MKTKILFLFFLLVVSGCNLALPGDQRTDNILDVDYINDMLSKVTLVSYKDGLVKDKFEVKAKSRKRFNNATIKVNGDRINMPFILELDSVVIVLDKISVEIPKHKRYIKQCMAITIDSIGKPCYRANLNDVVFGYGSKSINSNQRKWYSLNKGEFFYRYTFDEKFFENASKMYDFKARGF